MSITYEEALKAQSEIEDQLLDDPNVVSIGVVAEINDLGEQTGNYVIQVGVISIDTAVHARHHRQSIIPAEHILQSTKNSSDEKHVHINVIREGKIEALLASEKLEESELPSAIDKDTIATLHRWVPLTTTGINYVDAAIAEVMGTVGWRRYVSPHITRIGTPGELSEATMGMAVEKVGRTTGYTRGVVDSLKHTIKINFPIGILTFRDQIRTTNMSKPGDSGACLVQQGTKKPIGLLFAGSDSASFFNPMKRVLSSLSKAHVSDSPLPKTHQFKSTPQQRIIRRTLSTSAQARSYPNTYNLIAEKSFRVPAVKRIGVLAAVGSFFLARSCETAFRTLALPKEARLTVYRSHK